MFLAAGTLPEDRPVEADLLIVGAGPAGLMLAREQADRGLAVIVLESGGLEFSGNVQRLNRGAISGAPNHLPVHSRIRVYGGSTTRWAGQCVPLEPIDFEERAGIPHSGWPFDRAHLDPWYARASERLGCTSQGFGEEVPDRAVWPPLPIDTTEIGVSQISFARPLDIGATLREGLQNSATVRVVLGATVTAIETSADMTRATGVRFATFGGRTGRCAARKVVLAGGGIENPRLLLASTYRSDAGVGNANGVVGRYFMDHPYLMPGWLDPADQAHDAGWHVIETFEAAAEAPGSHAVFTLDPDIRRREDLPGCVGYFVRREAWQLAASYYAPGGSALTHLADVTRGDLIADTDLRRHALNLARSAPSTVATLAGWAASAVRSRPRAGLRICLEATPQPESRVTLSNSRDALGQRLPNVHWKIGDRDWRALDRFRTSLARALEIGGCGRLVYDASTDPDGYPLSMTGGRHHMGTTRMHIDPKQGVVDADLRVHGMENLYVLGSSVFPTGGWANPTLTIAALALRLSDHLSRAA